MITEHWITRNVRRKSKAGIRVQGNGREVRECGAPSSRWRGHSAVLVRRTQTEVMSSCRAGHKHEQDLYSLMWAQRRHECKNENSASSALKSRPLASAAWD